MWPLEAGAGINHRRRRRPRRPSKWLADGEAARSRCAGDERDGYGLGAFAEDAQRSVAGRLALRMVSRDDSSTRWANDLRQRVDELIDEYGASLHDCLGMHLPADADGNPHQPIAPGDTWSPSWRIDQPAATLWYHPYPHGRTADHVCRGVAGLFLIDDPDAPSGLPSDYGVDDIPVTLQDKRLGDDGDLEMSTPTGSAVGQLGDTILVNGTYNPHVEVHDELVRLRVLNASNGRVYNLGFDDDRSFHVVGTDGGLFPEPYTTTRVQVSSGERVEILARFSPGGRPVLRS
jgi:FtsP/CotA-like multicopper oxidase with cupredoxin domain